LRTRLLEPLPQLRIGLLQGDPASDLGLELALLIFEVFVELRLVLQVKRNRTIDPGELSDCGKVLKNLRRRLPAVEGINYRIK